MLERLILEQGYKGEAGRLARLESIDYEKITVLRIEFQNLLKINHLFVLTNLKELSLKFNKLDKIENIEMLTKLVSLDLSFNFIEKIDNLNTLTNLETLSLYNNQIESLENLDMLENLLILSVGNNRINALDGIARLRFLKKLRALNLEGNPITVDTDRVALFRIYVSAVLPDLKYYNYVYISKEERQKGLEVFKDEIAQIEEDQSEEIKERLRVEQVLADQIRLSSCFVEFLNEHQLFESMFLSDENGKILRLIGDEAEELINDYKKEIFELTQQIYTTGLQKHESRLQEIELFQQKVNATKKKTQKEGIEIVEKFLESTKVIFDEVKVILSQLNNDDVSVDDENGAINEYDTIRSSFHFLADKLWHNLMASEMKLFECIETAISDFKQVVDALLNEFIEYAQAIFVQMRNAEINFSGALHETVARYITMKAVVSEEDTVAAELQECFEDKSNIGKFILASREHHILVIDTREERLITRGRSWANELIAKMQSDEIDRNRAKIVEINSFLEKQRERFENLQGEAEKTN
ncbi:Dynein regulatory complex subunit 3 [Pseudolycoriella hygida]|uniref:Dynein axonemal assembly factor 1 homolog n=1 Tax=Pseudolycoriella hygida TaxID=35572 RepID=A0A9Q0NFT9_9DIPT|nr:Dynein regulatory complex subunit 3 [Pseudolycoriella hygida]